VTFPPVWRRSAGSATAAGAETGPPATRRCRRRPAATPLRRRRPNRRPRRARAGRGGGARERGAFRQITRDAAAACTWGLPTAHQLASQAIALNAANAQPELRHRLEQDAPLRRRRRRRERRLALGAGQRAVPAHALLGFASRGSIRRPCATPRYFGPRRVNLRLSGQGLAWPASTTAPARSTRCALRALDQRYMNRYERGLAASAGSGHDLAVQRRRRALGAGRGGAAARPALRASGRALGRGRNFGRLAILNVVSAGWREKVHSTLRRAVVLRAVGEASPAFCPAARTPRFGRSTRCQGDRPGRHGRGLEAMTLARAPRGGSRRCATRSASIARAPALVNEAKLVAQLRHPNIVESTRSPRTATTCTSFRVRGRAHAHDLIKADGQ